MSNSIVPFREQPAPPENQASAPETPTWKEIRRELFDLFKKDFQLFNEDGSFKDGSVLTLMTIIFGLGSAGPTEPMSYDDGILYITGNSRKYLQRAKRSFIAFHMAHYRGHRQTELDDAQFTDAELGMYRLQFCWWQARRAYDNRQNNLQKNKKDG